MTYTRLLEIEKNVLAPISDIEREVNGCADTRAVFIVGYHLGILRNRLREELEKELKVEDVE